MDQYQPNKEERVKRGRRRGGGTDGRGGGNLYQGRKQQ